MEKHNSMDERKAQLMGIFLKEEPLNAGDEALCVCCAMDREEGAELCAAFTDEELLDLLRITARRLGHSPAQGECHWLLRQYLRSRFRNWPGALRAAGLSRAAGQGGLPLERAAQKEREVQQLLDQVRAAAKTLGRLPHPSDLPEVGRLLSKRYRTWSQVLTAAGADKAVVAGLRKFDDLSPEDKQQLDRLGALAQGINRAPLRSEVDPELWTALVRRFGSWRNALYQIGLEPVQRITPFVNAPLARGQNRSRAAHRGDLYDCHYRLLRPDQETAADLAFLQQMAERLGRPPRRREVPPEIRRRLQEACGSWSNALFQLGLEG